MQMQEKEIEEILRSAERVSDVYDVEIYIAPRTRGEHAATAAMVALGLALLALAVILPLWWQRLICVAAYGFLSVAFDQATRLRPKRKTPCF